MAKGPFTTTPAAPPCRAEQARIADAFVPHNVSPAHAVSRFSGVRLGLSRARGHSSRIPSRLHASCGTVGAPKIWSRL